MTRMARIGGVAAGLAMGLAASLLADRPSDTWTVDYRVKSQQFHIQAKRASTPRWVFTLQQGAADWTATGWTVLLRYFQSDSSEALCTVTGTVAGAVVTFDAGTNVLGEEIREGYAAITVASNTLIVTYAVGQIDVEKAPEIGTTNRFRPSITVNGADYGPFVGDFSEWPLGGASWTTTTNWVTAQGYGTGNLAKAVADTLYDAAGAAVGASNGVTAWVTAQGYGTGNLAKAVADTLYDPQGTGTTTSNGVTAWVTAQSYGTGNLAKAVADTLYDAAGAAVGASNGVTAWVTAQGYGDLTEAIADTLYDPLGTGTTTSNGVTAWVDAYYVRLGDGRSFYLTNAWVAAADFATFATDANDAVLHNGHSWGEVYPSSNPSGFNTGDLAQAVADGLYLGLHSTADDSTLLDGQDSTAFETAGAAVGASNGVTAWVTAQGYGTGTGNLAKAVADTLYGKFAGPNQDWQYTNNFDQLRATNLMLGSDSKVTLEAIGWTLTNQLISQWCLNDTGATTNLTDARGANTAYINGGKLASTMTTAGKIETAMALAGSPDYIKVNSSASLNSPSTAVSVSFWIKKLSPKEVRCIWIKTTSGGSDYFFYDNNGSWYSGSAGGVGAITAGTPWTSNVWNHLVLVWSSGTYLKLYQDSVLQGTDASPGTITSAATPLYMGQDGSGTYASGYAIDDVRIWSRLLSQTEINYLNNSGTGTETNSGAYATNGVTGTGTGTPLFEKGICIGL